jgi:hypothetical protein
MTANKLKEVLARVERWPEAAQAELVLEIDAEHGAGAYQATKAELEGIDRGLKGAAEGRFATSEQVDDLFRKHRPT